MLDDKSNLPLYSQLYNKLLDNIATGRWVENYKIPTEEELCKQYNISRITVRMAMDKLKMQGYLYRKQGKGSFVTSPAIEQPLTSFYSFSSLVGHDGHNANSTVLGFEILTCPQPLANLLEIGIGDPIYAIERIRSMDGKPFAHEVSYIPCKVCPGLSGDSIGKIGLYNSMQQIAGFAPDRANEKFRAVAMDKIPAGHLGGKVGQAAFSIQRISYYNDRIVEFCDTIARGDMISYQVELPNI